MQLTFTLAGRSYSFDSSSPIDVAIPLDFHGGQPNAFHLPPASATAAEGGDFIGDTRRGGSCNCETVTLNPHGNGTHTECVGHVTKERLSVGAELHDSLIPAALVSVKLNQRKGASVTADALCVAMEALGDIPDEFLQGLLIRTLPNDSQKREAKYSGKNPPWISPLAMELIRERGVDHLLVDLPSVDREDDPMLEGHRIFWEAEDGQSELGRHRSITEMIYVDDAVKDGLYMLNLQVPPFMLDAAPSRPRLFSVAEG